MKWMPKWIGKRYASLWSKFKEEPFSYSQASSLLKQYTSNYLSELKTCQSLFTFGRGRRARRYRLIPPNLFIYAYAHQFQVEGLKSSLYTSLLVKFFYVLKEDFGENLLAMGVFGSVARGTATKESDIDILILVKNLDMSLLERTKRILHLKNNAIISQELAFLDSLGYTPQLNCYMRQPEELKVTYFTIDLSYDLHILFDEGILQEFLHQIEKRIKEKAIQRVYLDEEKYYLDLGLEFGEAYEF